LSEKLNSKCPVCNGYLFDDDDIVYCPVCGAPHHRDCYNAIGHCGREEEHGKEPAASSDNEHKTENVCEYCGRELPGSSHFCPYCGKIQPPVSKADRSEEDDGPEIKFIPFAPGGSSMPKIDPYGGLDKDSSIDGVKVKDLAGFISFAPGKLLPKWKQFQDGVRTKSWNWMAFLSPYTHAIFRKMDFAALMYILLELAGFVLLSPFYYALAYMDLPLDTTATQMMEIFMADPFKYISPSTFILAWLGISLLIGYRLFAGFRSDLMYKNHAISTIKKIRADLDCDDEYEFYKKGGVRPIIALLVLFLAFQFSSYIPLFIADFLF